MGLTLRPLGKKLGDLWSRGYDQVNVFDNGLSATTRQVNPNVAPRSVLNQAGAIGTGIVRAPVQGANTVKAGAGGLYGLGKIGASSIFGSDQDYQNTLSGVSRTLNRDLNANSGLLGQGTFFSGSQEALNLTPGQLAGKSLGYGSQIASLVAPELRIGKLPRVVSRPIGNFGIGGVGSAGSQYVETGRVDPKVTFRDASTAAALGETIPLARASVKLAKPRAPLNERGAVGRDVTQPVTVSEKEWQSISRTEPKVPSKRSQGTTNLAPLPEAKLPTVVAKDINPVQKVFMSTRGELSRLGTGGSELASRLDKWRTNSELGQQAFLDSIPTVTKLGKEFPRFVDTLDALSRGERPQMSAKIARAVDEWAQNITRVQQAAVAAGKDVGSRGPFYFPREYSDLLKTRSGFNAAVNHLVRTGQAATPGEAIQQLRFMKSGRTYGHFKTREFDIPGYDKSPDALTKYIAGAFDDISKAKQFGPNNEIGNQLLGRIGEEGYDIGRATRNLDIALNNVDRSTTGHKISSGIRKFNSVRSLSSAGISNATQLPVNTSTIAGFGRTLKGAIKTAISPEARMRARQTGVLLDSAIENLSRQGLGTGGKISRNIAAPLFRQIEKFNREATAVVGSDWGNSLAKKAAKGNTRAEAILRDKLRITGELGPKLTREQEIQASRALVERAQFKVDPQDLPGWVDSPTGKLAAQFRTFGYKQTAFMYNEVIREALKGNFLPLTRFVAIAIPAGAASQYLKSQIKGVKYTEPGESKTTQGLKAISAVGGGGLVSDTAQNLYKSAQYGNLEGGLAGTIGGPTASFLTETAVNTNKAIQGNPKPIVKQVVRSIPGAGPSIANRAFPKQEQPTTAVKLKTGEQPTVAYLNQQADKEKKELEKTTRPGDYSLRQLPNGKYLAQIDGELKEFKDLEAARMASRKDKFDKSGAKSKVIGDTYFYKTKSGDVKTQPKILHDFDQSSAKNKLEMDKAEAAKNISAWMGYAQKEYDALEKKKTYFDPETEQDEIDKISLQQENLMQKAEKYLSKGFGGSGRGGGTRTAGSAYKYAVSLNAGGQTVRPRVTVRGAGGGARPVARRTAGLPAVSLKKSLV